MKEEALVLLITITDFIEKNTSEIEASVNLNQAMIPEDSKTFHEFIDSISKKEEISKRLEILDAQLDILVKLSETIKTPFKQLYDKIKD